jgi:hypothetical protein
MGALVGINRPSPSGPPGPSLEALPSGGVGNTLSQLDVKVSVKVSIHCKGYVKRSVRIRGGRSSSQDPRFGAPELSVATISYTRLSCQVWAEQYQVVRVRLAGSPWTSDLSISKCLLNRFPTGYGL